MEYFCKGFTLVFQRILVLCREVVHLEQTCSQLFGRIKIVVNYLEKSKMFILLQLLLIATSHKVHLHKSLHVFDFINS